MGFLLFIDIGAKNYAKIIMLKTDPFIIFVAFNVYNLKDLKTVIVIIFTSGRLQLVRFKLN